MSVTELLIKNLEFSRVRTLGQLDSIEKEPDPNAVLSWRPGPGRAHIGWQLMHIAITEEIFATERLAPEKDAHWKELWPRFRGGSTSDDDVPTVAMIRDVLKGAREHLLGTLRAIGDDRLEEIPEALRERKITVRDVFFVIAWHEAHHQGQSAPDAQSIQSESVTMQLGLVTVPRFIATTLFLVLPAFAVAQDRLPTSKDRLDHSQPRAIRHSDVVFMYDNPKLYETYGCTVLGWAGFATPKHIEEAHAKGVRLFSTSVGFLTEASRVIDFSPDFLDAACRNFEGQPFIVPWLWDHKHKGQPAWWWCTNSPVYRKYLEQRLAEVMKARPDGLHIDDYRGTSGAVTWRSACFCRYCMTGFREYLAKEVPKEKLATLGIRDLDHFDYRAFLIAKGAKPSEYQNQRWKLPLAAEFLDYQVKANTAYVADYRRKAEKLRGQPLALCVNSGLDDAQSLAIAPQLSYFCCEVGHAAPNRSVPKHPIYIYKLADGLNRPVTSTASGQDWDYIAEHKLPGLVRSWIALSYAFGHNFMAPHHQWCYTDKKGTHWYEGPTEEYAWLYQFVRQNSRLLDGYEAVAPVAVVYDNTARRRYRGDIQPICTTLAERNIPFTVVVAGDDWLDYRLDSGRMSGFKAVIVTKDMSVSGGQHDVIEKIRTAGRLVVWPDDALLDKLVPSPVQVAGADHVTVVPRNMPGNPNSPVAIHLLNCRYDPAKDTMLLLTGFTLRLRRDLLPNRRLIGAVLHSPRAEAARLDVRTEGDYVTITIPSLDLWAVLELLDGKQ